MTKAQLIERLADVADDAQIRIGVMYMNGDCGEGAYYAIDDVQIDDKAASGDFVAICTTVQHQSISKLFM